MSQNFERSQKFKADPESILALINNFEAYKNFLPGCLESRKLSEDSKFIIRGLLVFGFLNKTYEFESENQTDGYHVQIDQVSGPFSQFSASWALEPLDCEITSVLFKASFKIPFFLKIFLRQEVIDSMGDRFLNAFAEQLYK